jgi:hypothetical protein
MAGAGTGANYRSEETPTYVDSIPYERIVGSGIEMALDAYVFLSNEKDVLQDRQFSIK